MTHENKEPNGRKQVILEPPIVASKVQCDCPLQHALRTRELSQIEVSKASLSLGLRIWFWVISSNSVGSYSGFYVVASRWFWPLVPFLLLLFLMVLLKCRCCMCSNVVPSKPLSHCNCKFVPAADLEKPVERTKKPKVHLLASSPQARSKAVH